MRRRLTKVAVFLLLGAIINVAVTWWVWVWIPGISHAPHDSAKDIDWWKRNAPAGFADPDDFYFEKRFGYEHAQMAATSPTFSHSGFYVRYGWPSRSLELSEWTAYQGPDARQAHVSWRHAWKVGEVRWLPLLPLWPGFAINTVFYAAMLSLLWWSLFIAPGQFRRLRGRWRIKRGLCPACAYPVGTNPHCTECGRPVG